MDGESSVASYRSAPRYPKLASMDDSQKRKSRLETGHVLFIDVAGYSKLTTEDESEALPELNRAHPMPTGGTTRIRV